ncbi:MAG: PAS domain S-box protein [Puniceicoccales bacterium]|jgi:PAS domain S-box-containing protein|nr:PAS domain S-box protein [Puniceicoccales bacterium]
MNDDGVKKLFEKVDVLDIVDLRVLVKRLWKQREFFKKIFDISRDSIVAINSEGEIFYCNRSASELLGIDKSKPVNILWKYVPEFIIFSNFDISSIGEENSFFSKEIKVSYPQKRMLSVTVTAPCENNINDGEGKIFFLRIIDVTEEQSASKKILNNERISSLTLLASGVAHEIGNPLNAISLRLQLMRRQFKLLRNSDGRMQLETSVSVCLDEISRLDSIVRNFLHAIRPQNPKLLEVSLNKILGDTLALMETEFKSLNIKIVRDVKQLPTILGDFSQLKQVFFNVLKNSCEAISGGGTIIIEGTSNDSDAILTFTDSGAGISCEVFDKIFQPYFSTKREGNGLGMMIVEGILRAHDATIDIASTKNVGTKISISFPRKDKSVPLLNSKIISDEKLVSSGSGENIPFRKDAQN